MKYTILILLLVSISCFSIPVNKETKVTNSNSWDKIVLRNEVTFKNRKAINFGASFLIKLDTGIIACTAKDLIETAYAHEKILMIKDFPNELVSWKMYRVNSPSEFVTVKSIAFKERIEKKILFFYLSRPFLTFSIEKPVNSISALEPDVSPTKNKDTVYIVGYGNENQIKVIKGIVETWDNSKYTDFELRIHTKKFLNDWNYVGSPIMNKEGKVIGVFNRAYALKKNKKGKIISDNKNPPNSYYDFFVGGTTMRLILGKNYGKKKSKTNH